jgi:hypothetical protein
MADITEECCLDTIEFGQRFGPLPLFLIRLCVSQGSLNMV